MLYEEHLAFGSRGPLCAFVARRRHELTRLRRRGVISFLEPGPRPCWPGLVVKPLLVHTSKRNLNTRRMLNLHWSSLMRIFNQNEAGAAIRQPRLPYGVAHGRSSHQVREVLRTLAPARPRHPHYLWESFGCCYRRQDKTE